MDDERDEVVGGLSEEATSFTMEGVFTVRPDRFNGPTRSIQLKEFLFQLLNEYLLGGTVN